MKKKISKKGSEPQIPTVPPSASLPPMPSSMISTSPSPKKSKTIMVIIGGIVLIAVTVLGYGFYNSKQIKTYAEKVDKMANEAKGWEDLFKESASPEESKKNLEKIKNDSEKFLTELNQTKAPKKAKELESNLKELFRLSKEMSESVMSIADWAIAIQSVGEELSKISSFDTSSPEAFTSSLKSAKDKIDESLNKLKSMQVPGGLSEQHKAVQSYLEEISSIFDKFIKAMESQNYNAISSISNELAGTMNKLSEIESPEESLNKIYGEDADKIDELEKKIDDQIKELKSVGTFVF